MPFVLEGSKNTNVDSERLGKIFIKFTEPLRNLCDRLFFAEPLLSIYLNFPLKLSTISCWF